MRTLFIIVALLGFLLIGLGAYEFRAVNEENTRIAAFGETSYESIYGHKVPPAYKLIWTSDDTVELEIISMVIVATGAVLAGIGLIGVVSSPKNLTAPATSEKT